MIEATVSEVFVKIAVTISEIVVVVFDVIAALFELGISIEANRLNGLSLFLFVFGFGNVPFFILSLGRSLNKKIIHLHLTV